MFIRFKWILIGLVTLLTNSVYSIETTGQIPPLPYKYINLACEPYTDHAYYFIPILQKFPISRFLEFGLGKGTEVFLTYCKHVTSFEMVTQDSHLEWFNICKDLYSERSNWNAILFECDELLLQVNNIALQEGDLRKIQGYKQHLESIVSKLCEQDNFECAFVDSGFIARADLVMALFNKVPIIAAHDTSGGTDAYGWNRIVIPSNYTKVVLPTPQGLTFWVDKSKSDLISYLKFLQANHPFRRG
jgi:hypothetical protein